MARFTVLGDPQGKARARCGKGFAYTPEKTVLYENLIKTNYEDQCNVYYGTMEDGKTKVPLEIYIQAHFSIPKSMTKKDRKRVEAGQLYPTKKPDADNIAKVVCDALNGVAYYDDTQIVNMAVSKRYTSGMARVEVEIVPFESME